MSRVRLVEKDWSRMRVRLSSDRSRSIGEPHIGVRLACVDEPLRAMLALGRGGEDALSRRLTDRDGEDRVGAVIDLVDPADSSADSVLVRRDEGSGFEFRLIWPRCPWCSFDELAPAGQPAAREFLNQPKLWDLIPPRKS